MTMLAITVVGVQSLAQTASPGVAFRLRVEELSGRRVHALALRCQLRIEPRRRRYTSDEQGRLYELFGDASQWNRTLTPVVWAHSSMVVPSFDKQIDVDLPVHCTYDLEVGSAKYLHAVREGGIPLMFLFSGTTFNVNESGICVEPVPWDLEASYTMPAQVWHQTMDEFFPGGGWLRVRRDTIDKLQAFRGRQAAIGWDDTIDLLLQRAASQEPV